MISYEVPEGLQGIYTLPIIIFLNWFTDFSSFSRVCDISVKVLV